MNFGKLGLVIFVLGLLVAAGAGLNWMSLDQRATNASVEMTLADNTYDRMDRMVEGQSLRVDIENMKRWVIGGSIAALLGVGMIFASGGNAGPTRTCPKCAETVQAAAVVCKHCGADLGPIKQQPGKSSYKALAKAAEEAERKKRV